MSEHKTKKERIQELLDKIHDLRKRKLLQIDYIEQEEKKIVENLGKLDEDLQKIQKDLNDDKVKLGKATVLYKIIEARKKVLEGYKSTLKECRMMQTLLIKEEGKLQFELVKAHTETE